MNAIHAAVGDLDQLIFMIPSSITLSLIPDIFRIRVWASEVRGRSSEEYSVRMERSQLANQRP